ncbi:MAG TPA: flagellar basal-body MS-ring/collar protein FliF, partial [Acidimicrobiia bacterium]|nr:flagellar basal-body MS-ring/collar protein FliF [Acidimicrobiia bacterium]
MPSLDLDALRKRAGSMFSGFTAGQKMMTGLAALVVVVGGFVFMQWAGRPSYSPLFSNLQASDAAAITEKLNSDGVPYELANGGTTIMVPDEQVHQLRIDLSGQGLPSGGASGYALLDKQGITTSEFRQRVDYQRALEGELSKTITAIEGIDAATVHLVIPRDDLFADDDTKPTASVMVKTAPGTRVSARRTQAIVHLVSASVEGLNPNDVTVTDSNGNLLASGGADGLDAAAGDVRAEQTTIFEQGLEEKIQAMLTRVVGADGADVKVKADLNFDKIQTREEQVEPADPAATTNERTVNETFEGTNSAIGGVLGPNATPTGNEGTSEYQREEQERQMAVNRVT